MAGIVIFGAISSHLVWDGSTRLVRLSGI